jgi:hypothetical protein
MVFPEWSMRGIAPTIWVQISSLSHLNVWVFGRTCVHKGEKIMLWSISMYDSYIELIFIFNLKWNRILYLYSMNDIKLVFYINFGMRWNFTSIQYIRLNLHLYCTMICNFQDSPSQFNSISDFENMIFRAPELIEILQWTIIYMYMYVVISGISQRILTELPPHESYEINLKQM